VTGKRQFFFRRSLSVNSEAELMSSPGEQFSSILDGAGMMPLVHQPHWYAIRTRSRHEKIASEQLRQQGIETFLPLVKRTHKWSDRVKEVELPLFAGYSFVRVVLCSPDRVRVLRAQGVAGFVGIHGSGTPIPETQIEDIRKLLASKVPFEECPALAVGQRVRIRGGSRDGVEGILAARNGDQSLMISIEPIQRSLCIRVQGYGVEAV
jgi:transcription antitermination factor NusG